MVTIGLIQNFQVLLLIMARMLAMFAVAPFFSSFIIPFRVKALLAFLITIVIFPMVLKLNIKAELDTVPFLMQIAGEVLIGLLIGFMISIFFVAFQYSGQLFSMQMGLGISMVFDPQSQIQIPIMGQLLALFAMLVFIAVNAHHHLIAGVYKSYINVPVLNIVNSSGVFAKGFAEAFQRMFGAAISIGLPVIGTAFIISVTLGLLAKAAPQMNVLMLGFPIQIAVGISVVFFAIPFILRFMSNWIELGIKYTWKLLASL